MLFPSVDGPAWLARHAPRDVFRAPARGRGCSPRATIARYLLVLGHAAGRARDHASAWLGGPPPVGAEMKINFDPRIRVWEDIEFNKRGSTQKDFVVVRCNRFLQLKTNFMSGGCTHVERLHGDSMAGMAGMAAMTPVSPMSTTTGSMTGGASSTGSSSSSSSSAWKKAIFNLPVSYLLSTRRFSQRRKSS